MQENSDQIYDARERRLALASTKVYVLEARCLLKMMHEDSEDNLRCVSCGTPLWESIGRILVSKRQPRRSVRRCLECAIHSNVLSSNVTPEIDIQDEEDA